MKACVILFALLSLAVVCSAQRCDYSSKMQQRYDAIPGLKEEVASIRDRIMRDYHERKNSTTHRRGGVNIVPVVWHILYNVNLPGSYVTKAQIDQEMIWLNDWFSAQNVNYGSASSHFSADIAVAGDFEIQFVLASTDPNGNSHPGIEYRETTVATTCNDIEIVTTSMGGLDAWDNLQYMNIHTCNIDSLGYAYLPSGTTFPRDGMVLQYPQLGDPFFSGSTISHEMGHWLGLPHTFEGCGVGDGIDDTPPTDLPTFDYTSPSQPCPGQGGAVDADFQRCGGIVMVQNNMDYNYEQCLSYFSKDQVGVMNGFISDSNGIRGGLVSSIGLTPQCPTFDCTNKVCGDNGCGGECGTCTLNQSFDECSPDGSACQPCPTYDCTNKFCGDDGCGGTCGTCGSGQSCSGTFNCESPNESCETAIMVSVTSSMSSYTGSNIGSDIADTTCGTDFGNTGLNTLHPIYYTFTSTVDGTISVDTSNSPMDTTLSFLEGSCGALTCLSFNDDENFAGEIYTSTITSAIEEGKTYVIIVGGYDTTVGSFELNIILDSFVPSPPPSVQVSPSQSAPASLSAPASQSAPASPSAPASQSAPASPSAAASAPASQSSAASAPASQSAPASPSAAASAPASQSAPASVPASQSAAATGSAPQLSASNSRSRNPSQQASSSPFPESASRTRTRSPVVQGSQQASSSSAPSASRTSNPSQSRLIDDESTNVFTTITEFFFTDFTFNDTPFSEFTSILRTSFDFDDDESDNTTDDDDDSTNSASVLCISIVAMVIAVLV